MRAERETGKKKEEKKKEAAGAAGLTLRTAACTSIQPRKN